MKNNNGIKFVGGENDTTGQVYNGTGITSVIINGAIQLMPELWGYYLLGLVIFFLFKKMIC